VLEVVGRVGWWWWWWGGGGGVLVVCMHNHFMGKCRKATR
jgi:hypothetical protein